MKLYPKIDLEFNNIRRFGKQNDSRVEESTFQNLFTVWKPNETMKCLLLQRPVRKKILCSLNLCRYGANHSVFLSMYCIFTSIAYYLSLKRTNNWISIYLNNFWPVNLACFLFFSNEKIFRYVYLKKISPRRAFFP